MKIMVSVCIPTYNGALYLKEALNSVNWQTYQNFEVIISDDASQDATVNIIHTFKKEVDFPVFIYHHLPSGIAANWNNCLIHANGKYIKFLFQDDIMEPTCLEEMVKILEQYPKVALVAAKRDFIVEEEMNTEEIKKWIQVYGDLQSHMNLSQQEISILNNSIFSLKTFYGSPLNKIGEPSVVMFRKNMVAQMGFFREDLKQILDYEYWYRILKKYPVAIINKPLVRFRLHENQATQKNKGENLNDYKIYERFLYNNFLNLLHTNTKENLKIKYKPGYNTYIKIKNKIKKIIS